MWPAPVRTDEVKTMVGDGTIMYEVPVKSAEGYALGTLRVLMVAEDDWRLLWQRYMGVSAHLSGDHPPPGNEEKT